MKEKKFVIELFDFREVERLPLHHGVILYFESFVAEHILSEFDVIMRGKWIHQFSLCFDEVDYRNIPEHLQSFDGVDKGLFLLPSSSFSKELTKLYMLRFIMSKIKAHPKGEFIGFCEMMLDFIETFFTMNYKKVTPERFAEIRKNVNWEYLSSFAYPADMKDQHYFVS